MKFLKIYLIIFSLLISGCGMHKAINVQQDRLSSVSFIIPAGVDSTVAVEAKIRAGRLFVDILKEKAADSLYKYSEDFLNITEEIYSDLESKKERIHILSDSLLSMKNRNLEKESLTLEEKKKQEIINENIKSDSSTINIVGSLLDFYLDHCNEKLNELNKINEFNIQFYQGVARTCWDRGLIFNDVTSYESAIKALRNFLEYDKGYAFIYRDIGKNYFALKQWQSAHNYFLQANEIFLKTAYFEHPVKELSAKHKSMNLPSYVDPDKYFEYLKLKAESELKIYKADSAKVSYLKALQLANNIADSIFIKRRVKEWIDWDGGNIKAAETKFFIQDSLIKRGKYKEAKDKYLELLPTLITKSAKDNITWLLARIEYMYLEEFELAAKRFYTIVMSSDTLVNRKNQFYKAPDDSLYKVYFKDCGQIYFDLGNKFKNEGLFDKARTFYATDTTIDWKGRGKSLIPLAQLVQVSEDLAPEQRQKIYNQKRIKLLTRAKAFEKELSDQELDILYRSLIMIYQQIRENDKAAYNFNEYKNIKKRREGS